MDKIFFLSTAKMYLCKVIFKCRKEMAKITKSLSTLTDAEGCSRILFRITISRTLRMRVKTNIFVPRNRWNEERGEIVLPRMGGVERGELLRKREELAALEAKANRVCENATEPLTSEYMGEVLPYWQM